MNNKKKAKKEKYDDDLEIYPLKINDDCLKLKVPINPILPDLEKNFVLLMIMPRGSGKTTIWSNLLLRFFKRENYDYAFIISPTIYQDLTAGAIREEFQNTLYDHYDDKIVDDIISFQRSFEKKERPKTIIICDDCVGIKMKKISWGCTRFRHDNLNLIVSTQQLKSIEKVARNNGTDVIIGATKNFGELMDIYEEYGMLFGSKTRFLKMFNYATKEPYAFLYLKLDKKPFRAFKNFTEDITNKFPETEAKSLYFDELNDFNNVENNDK